MLLPRTHPQQASAPEDFRMLAPIVTSRRRGRGEEDVPDEASAPFTATLPAWAVAENEPAVIWPSVRGRSHADVPRPPILTAPPVCE